jgi:cell division transport system permease protein
MRSEARRADYLGLREALGDQLLPVLVAAMSFLAALAMAGALASAALAARWQSDAASQLTIQVPQPTAPGADGKTARLDAVLAALQAMPQVVDARVMSQQDVTALIAPWLGADPAQIGLPLPGVISARWVGGGSPAELAAALGKLAPGTLVQTGALWAGRVTALTASLQACAAAVLAVVALVAAAVVAVATRAGLAQRRETITLVHSLGALDDDIAARFAARITVLAFAGAAVGALLALPVLAWLAALAAPFIGAEGRGAGWSNLPPALLVALPALPLVAALIGWATAQLTVRRWLRRLP